MDFRPIQPSSTNKVNTSIDLANDGGSKSNTGYMCKRGAKNEEEQESSENTGDKINLSTASSQENEEDLDTELKKFFNSIKMFFIKLKAIFYRRSRFRKTKVKNIFLKKTIS